MRKYYQAALAIMALTSLVAVLFYRHEYNRLRYVLEVFNYFGTRPDGVTNCTDALQILPNSMPYGRGTFDLRDEDHENFDEPIAAWQRLNDEIYIYSAYRVNVGEIRAIGLTKEKSTNLSTLSCDVFMENAIEPISGIFTHRPIERSTDSERATDPTVDYHGHRFVCRYEEEEDDDDDESTGSIRFSIKTSGVGGNEERATVALALRDIRPRKNKTNDEKVSVVCVAPSSNLRPIIDTDMTSFLSHHTDIGVERFIVYDSGIPSRFNALVKRVLSLYGWKSSRLVTYTTIPWNVPFAKIPFDTVEQIVEADCLYRTTGRAYVTATLSWDEYIVLKHHSTIDKLFSDIEKTGYTADRYRVSSLDFCVDRPRDFTLAPPRIFADNATIRTNRPVFLHRRSTSSDVFEDPYTRETTPDLVVANRYSEHCDSIEGLETVPPGDPRLAKFSKLVRNSEISKLFGSRLG